jgi:hypothetical protein
VRRRGLITILGGAVTSWPLPSAQRQALPAAMFHLRVGATIE